MPPEELRAALDKLGLTQQKAAELFGHDQRAMRYWVAGHRAIPQGIAILLRLLVAGKITIGDVARVR